MSPTPTHRLHTTRLTRGTGHLCAPDANLPPATLSALLHASASSPAAASPPPVSRLPGHNHHAPPLLP